MQDVVVDVSEVRMDDLAEASAIPMQAGVTYALQVEIDQGVVTLRISDEHGALLGTLSADSGAQFTEMGILVGRNSDGQLTCAANFRIEDLE